MSWLYQVLLILYGINEGSTIKRDTMSKKILVIEDNPSMLENIADIIWLANYEAITAPNGKLGVELMPSCRPG
jgi:hypothetical protein